MTFQVVNAMAFETNVVWFNIISVKDVLCSVSASASSSFFEVWLPVKFCKQVIRCEKQNKTITKYYSAVHWQWYSLFLMDIFCRLHLSSVLHLKWSILVVFDQFWWAHFVGLVIPGIFAIVIPIPLTARFVYIVFHLSPFSTQFVNSLIHIRWKSLKVGSEQNKFGLFAIRTFLSISVKRHQPKKWNRKFSETNHQADKQKWERLRGVKCLW